MQRSLFRSFSLTLLIAVSVYSDLLFAGFAGARAEDTKFGPTPSPPGAAVYFVDLKDGATISTKTVIHFGLRNMGVAPAGSDKPNSGHHHLLIDTELPSFNEPIPSDFNHIHYGAGQSEAEVTLSPGEHTLQLILGDKNHIPHNPPVVSDRIKVKVVEDLPSLAYARKPSPPDAKVYFVYPTNNAVLPPNFTVRFGLIGMGVAPAGLDKVNTGHHHLIIDAPLPALDQPIPNDFNHVHYGLGQTEARLTLPLGTHTLQLLLADANHVPQNPPLFSPSIRILVTASGKRPVSHLRNRHRTASKRAGLQQQSRPHQ